MFLTDRAPASPACAPTPFTVPSEAGSVGGRAGGRGPSVGGPSAVSLSRLLADPPVDPGPCGTFTPLGVTRACAGGERARLKTPPRVWATDFPVAAAGKATAGRGCFRPRTSRRCGASGTDTAPSVGPEGAGAGHRKRPPRGASSLGPRRCATPACGVAVAGRGSSLVPCAVGSRGVGEGAQQGTLRVSASPCPREPGFP